MRNNTNLILSIKDLHLDKEKGKNTYLCQNFKIYPEGKELHGGYLFGIIEITATPKDEAQKIYQIIINTFRENYYKQIISSPEPQKINIETIFEFALNQTNQKILELIEIGQIKLIIDNLNYFIGAIKTSSEALADIIFTNKGSIKAFLIYRTKKNTNKIIDILKFSSNSNNHDKIKIFSSIAAGELKNHNTLIVCTEIFSNYISPEKILDILSKNETNEAINYFKTQIKQVQSKNDLSYSALFLRHELNTLTSDSPLSQKSINELIQTSETTEKLLTPAMALNIKKHFNAIKNKLKSSNKSKTLKEARVSSKEKQGQSDHKLPIWRNTYLFITGHKGLSLANIKSSIMKMMSSQKPKTKIPYIILAVIVVLIVAFTSSIFWFRHSEKVKQEQIVYTQQIENVKNLLSDAEASYIYKNNAQSMEKIKQAQGELAFLPRSTESQQINYENLDQAVSELYNKVLNIEKIVAQQIATIPAEQTLNKLELFNDSLLLADTSELFIGKIDNFEAVKSASISSLSLITNDETKALVLDNNQSLYSFSGLTVEPLNQKLVASPTAMKLYNGRLYALQKNSQTITRYTSNFTGNEAWIKNLGEENLSTAVSISIDGSIYVLSENGHITKFFAGTVEAFNNPVIEPEINSADKIITSPETNNLFIFEAETKRLLVISKTGDLTRQIVFDSMEKIDDLAVDNTGKNGFLISNNALYKFSL